MTCDSSLFVGDELSMFQEIADESVTSNVLSRLPKGTTKQKGSAKG